MPDELTGLAETSDTPDDQEPPQPDSPSPTASELAKKLNVDELPADAEEVYALASKRLDELRDMGRKRGEETKQELAATRAELEQIKQMLAPRQPARSGPPPGASDEEILNYYVDKRIAEKVDPRLSRVDRLTEFQATQMIDAMRSKYPDFSEYEDAIVVEIQENPTLSLEKAYKLVTADKAEERALAKFTASVKAKKEASGTLTRGGVSGTSLKDPDEDEIRSIPETTFWQRAFKAAERVHGE